jgi:hypothetical protein
MKVTHLNSLWLLSILSLLPLFTGCTSIHSDAVRELIKVQEGKTTEAKNNALKFVKDTDSAIGSYEKALEQLDGSRKELRKIEAVHTFIFSTKRNVGAKKGVDAQAVAYLIGELYMRDYNGLDQKVKSQFIEDFAALKKTGQEIERSWTKLKITHDQIVNFANRSGLASVDSELVKQLFIEFDVDTETLENVIKRSKQVNQALENELALNFVDGLALSRTQVLNEDLLNLVERIKK